MSQYNFPFGEPVTAVEQQDRSPKFLVCMPAPFTRSGWHPLVGHGFRPWPFEVSPKSSGAVIGQPNESATSTSPRKGVGSWQRLPTSMVPPGSRSMIASYYRSGGHEAMLGCATCCPNRERIGT